MRSVSVSAVMLRSASRGHFARDLFSHSIPFNSGNSGSTDSIGVTFGESFGTAGRMDQIDPSRFAMNGDLQSRILV